MNALKSPKVRRRVAATGAAVGLFAAFAGGVLLARAHLASTTAAAVESWHGRLESALEGRVNGITAWVDARLRDARLVASYPGVRSLFAAPANSADHSASRIQVQALLEAIIRFQPFRAAYVLDPGGSVVASAGAGVATPEALAAAVGHLQAVRTSRGGVIQDGRWSADLVTLPTGRAGGAVLFTSWVPTAPGDPPFGAVAFEEDPDAFLYPHLGREFVGSRTGQLMLVVPGRTSVATVDPRRRGRSAEESERSPLSRPLAEVMAARKAPNWEDVDDRRVPVLVTTFPVADTSWVLMAKVDRAEIVSPAITRAWRDVAAVTGILLASLGAAFGFWRNRQAAYMRERLALEEQLRQSQKMEAVGRLAGGVAHDFNNLLTVISGYAEMAKESRDARFREQYLAEIHEAADRASRLTRQLLAFGRKQVLQPRDIDLNEVVQDIEKLLRRLIGEDVAVVVRLAAGRLHTRADPGQLEQVLVNLVVNARDAMPSGGTLVISTDVVEREALPNDVAAEGVHAERYVRLTVSDTGTGMTPEVRAHVFEPFFTTKPSGQGTGLGLSTVYGIVKQSGGTVEVESQPGAGTSFSVYLPCVSGAEGARDEEPRQKAGDGGRGGTEPGQAKAGRIEPARTEEGRTGRDAKPWRTDPATGLGGRHGTDLAPSETVLVVEDSEPVRALVQHSLEQAGYWVLVAADAEEGSRVLASHAGPIHLLVADVVLPGRNGRELARDATAARPGLRVLYISGYPSGAVNPNGALDPSVSFLEKPFTPAAIVARVRDVLDRPATEAQA